MILDRLELINEEFFADSVTPVQVDMLLADGWRHFGEHFFRYNFGIYEGEIRRVIPLRIRLDSFKLSKSQRRSIRRNSDLDIEIVPLALTDEIHSLFELHKRRFKSGTPTSLFDFLSPSVDQPTPVMQVNVTLNGRLLAVSFFDMGKVAASSIYGIFDPEHSSRGLGIFTMLIEIQFAAELGKQFLYHGYAYEGSSFYDYKKRFSALEAFDWNGEWREAMGAS